ncbi:hypothetical protein DFJ74DRAFT_695365 [Hyaloraphidium curvatum]|nr:hypothetical protein DFJ74DRAFT_695365 [Hyaloraphidium curvatum]
MDFTDYLTQVEEQYRAVSHELLKSAAAKVKAKKVSCKAIAMRGDPRDEITRKCAELSADTLIMGSRGMGALKRAMLGSVSDHVIHHVHCPTIIVKTPPDWQPLAAAEAK